MLFDFVKPFKKVYLLYSEISHRLLENLLSPKKMRLEWSKISNPYIKYSE